MEDGSDFICSLSEIKGNGGRKRLKLRGRDIFLVLYEDQLFALDSFCYHAGGPLHAGDIEDVSGHSCIVCPWHKYKITLNSGEGLYHSVDPHNLKMPPKLCSKGVKQRTHAVTVQGDNVFIRLSTDQVSKSTLESDQYNVLADEKPGNKNS